MITVFLVFAMGGDFRAIKLFAIGLATAIFVDATIVRLVLVPSTMELLGDANWWLPSWLDRLLPNVTIEAHDADPHAELDPDHEATFDDTFVGHH
jgi:RND superfamily putative drug exporter